MVVVMRMMRMMMMMMMKMKMMKMMMLKNRTTSLKLLIYSTSAEEITRLKVL